jgi:hypothetical protein
VLTAEKGLVFRHIPGRWDSPSFLIGNRVPEERFLLELEVHLEAKMFSHFTFSQWQDWYQIIS